MAVTVLMCGSEKLFLNWSDERKIEATEMRFLIPMTGYTLLDKKLNSVIREQWGIFNIINKSMQHEINWREHNQRMDDNRLQKNNFKLKT